MKYDIMIIGSSAGGVEAFRRLFKLLPNLPLPTLVVHHIQKNSTVNPQAVYGTCTTAPIFEIEDKMLLQPGHIYFAPPDYHTLIEKDLTAALDVSEPVNFSRPSISVTLLSAAEELESRVIGILLTGASEDGAAGMQRLAEADAYTIVQSPADAEMPYMPASALRLFKPKYIGSIEEIANHLNQLLRQTEKAARSL